MTLDEFHTFAEGLLSTFMDPYPRFIAWELKNTLMKMWSLNSHTAPPGYARARGEGGAGTGVGVWGGGGLQFLHFFENIIKRY